VNSHTAIIRSFGITGVLLLLALVLLAIVSAIVAFDRWPDGGGASTVERVAVDRPGERRVETVLVRSRRPAPVVRGVFVARTAGTSATALGAGDVFLVGDREPTGQSDGGGFGPPPPSVPFAAPGEGGGGSRFAGTAGGGGGAPVTGGEEPPTIIEEATCGARDALGEAGAPLEPACAPVSTPGQRGALSEAVGGTVDTVEQTVTTVTGTLGLEGAQLRLGNR
jgi:hypothetical protein